MTISPINPPEGTQYERAGVSRHLGRRVLVSEDDPAIRTMLSTILKRRGFEVFTACDGAETIARLADPFDVVVLDLMMPAKSGYDVLDHLQKANPSMLQRVVVATAHSAVMRQPLQVPVAAVFIKPFDIVEFASVVTRLARASAEKTV